MVLTCGRSTQETCALEGGVRSFDTTASASGWRAAQREADANVVGYVESHTEKQFEKV